MYLFDLLFFVCLFSSDKSPEVELLGHMVVLFLIFWGNFIFFSIVIVQVYIFTNNAQGFHSLHILANILFLIFMVKVFVTGVRRYLTAVFICTSLTIDHPFVIMTILLCLLAHLFCLLWENIHSSLWTIFSWSSLVF